MKYDIAAIKRKMLVKYPFFGSVVATVTYKEEESIPTAATDGKNIYYNPKYLESLSIDEQTFVLAHEVCHIAFNHILRSEGREPRLWNIATDAVINQFLIRDGLKMVEGGIDIADAINYDAEQLYDKLLKEKEQNQQQQSSSGGGSSQEQSGSGSGEDSQEEKQQDAGHDTHSMWSDAVKEQAEEKSEESENQFAGMGEKEVFNKNLKERKKRLEKLKEEISKQASKAGTLSGGNVRSVGNIGVSKPVVDWRYVLKEAIKLDSDWSYRNAIVEDGIVTARLEEQPMPETEIVLDTSGSINENLLRNFLRECKNILQHTKLKVGCFDTEFYGFQDIRTESDIENMEFIGSGGTDFDVAVGAFSNRVENKIIFTDGEASMPSMPVDAIWIVFGDKRINPPGGKVIYIPQEQFNKLNNYESENNKTKR